MQAEKKRSSMKKKSVIKLIIFLIIFLGLTAAGLFYGRKYLVKKADVSEIYTVRKELYEDVIEVAGTAKAANEQVLQAQNDGTVIAVYVKEGDSVKKGDIILQLDDTTQQYNLAAKDFDIAKKTITASAKEIELMKIERASLVQKIQDRKVIATFDGVIVELNAAKGDYLEAKDTVGTLVDLSYLKTDVEIAETDVSRIKPGQKVIFNFPAYTKGTVEGHLVSYPAIGSVTSRGVTVVNAELRIDDYPPEILPNFSFTAKIEISEPQEYLIVEQNAIGYENGKSFAEVIKRDGSTERREVKVRPYGIGYVKIEDGLEGNENLKQLSANSMSGRFSKKGQKPSGKKNNNNMPGGFGAPPRR